MRISTLLLFALCLEARPLLVLSVDGLDHRYLRDADALGMKIPNLRKLMREGALADGVVGVVPTVTWPSHTTLISGVPPHKHGILGNRRPKSEGGDYYWTADLLKAPTLLDVCRKRGLKSAAITWPVTVDAPVDYNLPELFDKRNGGAMDLHAIARKATPGLIDDITRLYPAFPKFWVDDRARAEATMYLVREKKPDLVLVHLVDHDSEAHEFGPFSREAKALVEYTDQLIGDILRVLPKEYAVAIVSDHGFERIDKVVSVGQEAGPDVVVTPFLLLAQTEIAAARLRQLKDVGREIPGAEVARLGPQLPNAVAAFEPVPHVAFTSGAVPEHFERGNHGLWPTRPDYRSVYLLWGPGVRAQRLPEMQMTDIAARFAEVLGVPAP